MADETDRGRSIVGSGVAATFDDERLVVHRNTKKKRNPTTTVEAGFRY